MLGVRRPHHVGELVAFLRPRMGHDRCPQRQQLRHEARVRGVHAIQPAQTLLGVPLLLEPLLDNALPAIEGTAGVRMQDLLLRRLVSRQQAHQAPERLRACVARAGLHLVEEVADLTVLTYQKRHHVVLRARHVHCGPVTHLVLRVKGVRSW